MYLFSYSSGWGWSRRHRHKVDALWRWRCRLLQIIITLRTHNRMGSHFILHHIYIVQSRKYLGKSLFFFFFQKSVLEYYTTNSVWPWKTGGPVNSQSVNLACLYLSSLQKNREANNGPGPKHALGRYNKARGFKDSETTLMWVGQTLMEGHSLPD